MKRSGNIELRLSTKSSLLSLRMGEEEDWRKSDNTKKDGID